MSEFDDDQTVIANIPTKDLHPTRRKEDMIASLVQYSGNSSGKRYHINKAKMSLGRDSKCDITCNDTSVSRNHAQISDSPTQKTTKITDLGSSNGTYINKQKLSPNEEVLLKDQDMIRIGSILFKYFSHDNVDGMVQDKIYKMATIDPGTKIFNKQYLMDSLQNNFTRSKKSNTPLSLIYFDLDHFKKVNDNYGHNAGDQILRDCAALIKKKIDSKAIFARFGGEEFIIITPQTKLQEAHKIAETVRKSCEDFIHNIEYEKDGKKVNVKHTQTVSIGVSELTKQIETPKDLLEDADKKLYKSKESGRNKVTI